MECIFKPTEMLCDSSVQPFPDDAVATGESYSLVFFMKRLELNDCDDDNEKYAVSLHCVGGGDNITGTLDVLNAKKPGDIVRRQGDKDKFVRFLEENFIDVHIETTNSKTYKTLLKLRDAKIMDLGLGVSVEEQLPIHDDTDEVVGMVTLVMEVVHNAPAVDSVFTADAMKIASTECSMPRTLNNGPALEYDSCCERYKAILLWILSQSCCPRCGYQQYTENAPGCKETLEQDELPSGKERSLYRSDATVSSWKWPSTGPSNVTDIYDVPSDSECELDEEFTPPSCITRLETSGTEMTSLIEASPNQLRRRKTTSVCDVLIDSEHELDFEFKPRSAAARLETNQTEMTSFIGATLNQPRPWCTGRPTVLSIGDVRSDSESELDFEFKPPSPVTRHDTRRTEMTTFIEATHPRPVTRRPWLTRPICVRPSDTDSELSENLNINVKPSFIGATKNQPRPVTRRPWCTGRPTVTSQMDVPSDSDSEHDDAMTETQNNDQDFHLKPVLDGKGKASTANAPRSKFVRWILRLIRCGRV